MTSASQAGILHGNNDGIPAFRWYERDRKHLMVSSNPADAAEMVRRLSNGEGLLSNNGASICNLLTGDADAGVPDHRGDSGRRSRASARRGRSRRSSSARPATCDRSTMFLGEFFKELFQAARTRAVRVQPQMHRGLKYAGMRAASNVVLRDMNTSLIIYEMYQGANVIYADFTDYDEIAHHSDPSASRRCRRWTASTRAIATLVKAAEEAPRPYKFVVLSDHGQSLGATFKQRYGQSIGEVVRDLMGGRATVIPDRDPGRGLDVRQLVPVGSHQEQEHQWPTVARAALAGQTTDGVVDLDDHEELPPPADASTIAVVGSGNLGLIYFTGHDHRLTAEELEELHPNLVATLAAHPGVAMLHGPLVEERGGRVWTRRACATSTRTASKAKIPTELFGPHTVMSLKREDAMTHAPDLLLISQYDPELGEVAAFEELIGSHGGLGGPQTEPFILHPTEWDARRGRAARRAGDLSQPAPLAGRDRDPARQPSEGRAGRRDHPGSDAGSGIGRLTQIVPALAPPGRDDLRFRAEASA